MHDTTQIEAQFLGDLPPLQISKHGKPPERRQISKRWLASSVLVGLTSLVLMGGALLAALEGREKLTNPGRAFQPDLASGGVQVAPKGNHPGLRGRPAKSASNIMMVSTVSREVNKTVVKVRPFLNIETSLALAPRPQERYPSFNALSIFSESQDNEIIAKSSDFMYGADVEGEVTINIIDFPFDEVFGKTRPRQRTEGIAREIQSIAHTLEDGEAYVSALASFDSERFLSNNSDATAARDITVTAENVSVLSRYQQDRYPGIRFEKRVIQVRAENPIATILQLEGIGEAGASFVETVLGPDLGSSSLKSGDQMHAWFRHEPLAGGNTIKTVSKVAIYRGASHLVSIARNDDGRFVYAAPPNSQKELQAAIDQTSQQPVQNLPTVYDAIYRTALQEGLNLDLAASLVKIFAFDVDFRSRIGPRDQLELFVSLEEGMERPGLESEILYAEIILGNIKRRYYRFRDAETGRIGYYDETGKSAKKFLLRKPVPNGRFQSAFGMRRHPISRVYKLHGGVDWSAPRGTAILAAGSGVIKKAGWSGGYGKQTVIYHANGYETSYSHQTAIAKGVRPGKRVRQGQLIGYVGSTGYSTGPHLHYEVKVNGNRVDPMRIRLPKGKVLKDAELAAFEAERDRIDALINQEEVEFAKAATN